MGKNNKGTSLGGVVRSKKKMLGKSTGTPPVIHAAPTPITPIRKLHPDLLAKHFKVHFNKVSATQADKDAKNLEVKKDSMDQYNHRLLNDKKFSKRKNPTHSMAYISKRNKALLDRFTGNKRKEIIYFRGRGSEIDNGSSTFTGKHSLMAVVEHHPDANDPTNNDYNHLKFLAKAPSSLPYGRRPRDANYSSESD